MTRWNKESRCGKIEIIAVSSIQHPNECGAAGTCNDVTGTEDAVLLSDYVGYPGIPIELTHKRGDTRIKTRQNMMHLKPEPAAGSCYQQLTGCRLGVYLC